MAVYIKHFKKVSPAAYNADLTDSKVDFVLDEAGLEQKINSVETVVLPVISGAVDIEFTIGDETPDYADGVTAFDEQQGVLTEDILKKINDELN